MERSIKVGVSFGLTSGIITTLGLLVGLSYGTNSKAVVIGGIITIAIADAFSDSLGIHISEESQQGTSSKDVWKATLATFVSKFVFALTFLVPVIVFELPTAVILSVLWGLLALSLLSYFVAKNEGEKPLKVVTEHIFIAILVVAVTYLVGKGVSAYFG